MPTNNERATRRAVLSAIGASTAAAQNEQTYDKAVVAALPNINVKTKPAVVALVSLTDSTSGTADNTVAAVPAATAATTDTSAASLTSVNTTFTAIRNDFADLTAKVNAIIAALKA